MKHKVSELEGALLDAAVAMAEGRDWSISKEFWPSGRNAMGYVLKVAVCLVNGKNTNPIGMEGYGTTVFAPSRNWDQGGPIIERERICLIHQAHQKEDVYWTAAVGPGADFAAFYQYGEDCHQYEGATALIAAMRAYVSSKLGEEVDLPEAT